MLRVAIPPAEPRAVYAIRTRWPAEALAAQGKIELVPLPEVLDITEEQRPNDRPLVTAIKNLPEMDLIVFTRVLSERLMQLIPLIQQRGIKVICDIDDDFRHAQPNLPGRNSIHPKINPKYNWHHFVRACQLADHMTCSTPALQAYRPEASTVVRNCVPAHYLSLDMPRNGVPVVGWSGGLMTHPGDLAETRAGVLAAVMETNTRFRVVGDPKGVQQALGFPTPIAGTGWLPLEQYPIEVARLTVGIVPLADHAFNRAKSWITPLTMAAVGVPYVASPLPEYELFHQQLVRAAVSPPAALAGPRTREWKRELIRALRTPENERKEAVAQTREYIRHHHTYESQAERWLEVWETVAR